MRRRVVLDGVEHAGSDPFLLGPEKRMAIGIELPDGGFEAHYVELLSAGELRYRSLGQLDEEVLASVLTLVQQIG